MNLDQYLKNNGYGALNNLAKKIRVSPTRIYWWRNGREIPLKRVISIWIATKGQVSLKEMRPDIYSYQENKTEEIKHV